MDKNIPVVFWLRANSTGITDITEKKKMLRTILQKNKRKIILLIKQVSDLLYTLSGKKKNLGIFVTYHVCFHSFNF